MSKKSNERRCLTCHRLLIDEKLPFCYRCVLEGKDKVKNGGKIVVAGLSLISIGALASNNKQKPSNKNNKNKENDEDDEEKEDDLDEQ